MKTLAVALVCLTLALPAVASTRITVGELERTLAADHTLSDAKLADELSGLELTQRLSASTQARFHAMLPGPQSQQELSILAARSSFLDLPAEELPANPTPDAAEQRQIMAQVVTYVTRMVKKLPDFIATRDTRSFEDRPAGAYSYLPLHFTNQTSANVIYREGRERDTNSHGKKVDISAAGLVSWGEFGPILSTVLLDAAESQLSWSHWEQGATGTLAVFRYAVPAKKSHYQIQLCCVATPEDLAGGHIFHEQAPYHGEMAVDPSTGAIHRITVIADLGSDDPIVNASIAVQYGPVDIGGKTYICPVRSDALALRRQWDQTNAAIPAAAGAIPSAAINRGPVWTRLNEVTFANYHIYRGESRILTDAEVAQMAGQPVAPSNHEAAPTQPELAAQPPQITAESAPPAAPAAAAPASIPSLQPAVAASVPAQPASAPPQPTPDNSANTATPANSADIPVFRTTARQVLVDVIVDKKNGDPVAGLSQSNFSVEENSKPQTIDFFEEHSSSASAPTAAPEMPPLPTGAVSNVPAAASSAALYVFLLDSLNSEPQDQVFIHEQILAFLHKLDPGTQVAVLALGSTLHLVQGFTSDPAVLLAAVSKKGAERDAMAQNRSDSADDASHISKLQSMRVSAAKIEAMGAAQAAAQGYSFGARAAMTFEALNALARYLEGIPGRKNLIWFASSFPVVFFPTPSEMEKLKNNPNLPGYVNRIKQTANLFTVSKIAVYPVSGAGVASSNIGMADSPGAGSAGGTGHFGTAANPTSSLTAESLGSASALTGMEELASSTGGRAFTTNDINDALHKIVHDSDVYYTVGYAPAEPAGDGGFRRIRVSVSGGKYKLAYRQGYNVSQTGAAPAENPITPLLQLGLPSATGIYYGASVAPGSDQEGAPVGQNPQLKGPVKRYVVSFTIRAQDVSFGQAASGERIAKLLVGVKAYGADGAALNWQATREAVQLSAAQYESILKSGIPIILDLDLPADTPARLVTAVYDWNSDRSGTLELPVHP